MNLAELTNKKGALLSEKTNLKKDYESAVKAVDKNLKQITGAISLVSQGVDLARINNALKVLEVIGKCTDANKKTLAELAMSDLAAGCQKLKKQFFGFKIYSGFGEQRCDCEYGCGPRHGNIVFKIGLKDRRQDLTADQIEDCIYLLCNLDSLEKARQAA